MLYDLNKLNDQFAFPGEISFDEGKGKLPVINVETSRARAVIALLGGQVLSYHSKDATDDLLFVSDNAYYKIGKSTKGGIPVCWPCFAEGHEENDLPFHGFARTAPWEVVATGTREGKEAEIVLRLVDSDLTRSIWSHSFILEQRIHIGESLSIELITRNTGERPFEITQALHTYFSVGDISRISIYGLENSSYLDKVDGFKSKKQQAQIRISGEVDRIYQDVSRILMIEDPSLGRMIEIEPEGSHTTVVWNPWIDISANSDDLVDDDYKRFVCVETANAANEIITVAPGGQHMLGATYRIKRL